MTSHYLHESVNPFRFDLEIPWFRYIQIFFATFTLVPFRIAASVVAAGSIYLAGLAITIGLPLQADEFDIVGFRAKLQKFLTKVCYGFWRLCLGVRITTRGKPVSKEEAQVIVLGPHSTVYDTMIADQIPQSPFPWTVVGGAYGNDFCYRMFRSLGSIFVDRTDRSSTSNAISVIKSRVADPNWPQLMIWPEGTTHNRLGMMKFKNGAFNPGAVVQPLTLKWTNSWDTFTWCFMGPSFVQMIFLTLCQFTINVEINFLDPVAPTEDEKANPSLFAERVRKIMADSLEIPTLELTRDDGLAHMKATQYGLPGHVANIGIESYRKERGLSREKISEELRHYASLSQKKELADYDNLCTFLQLPLGPLTKELFKKLDSNSIFCFTFKNFLDARLDYFYPAAERINYEKLMECMDVDCDGAISLTDIQAVFPKIFGGQAPIYRQIWDLHSGGRKVLDLVDLKRICHDYPEYAFIYESLLESRENSRLSRVLG